MHLSFLVLISNGFKPRGTTCPSISPSLYIHVSSYDSKCSPPSSTTPSSSHSPGRWAAKAEELSSELEAAEASVYPSSVTQVTLARQGVRATNIFPQFRAYLMKSIPSTPLKVSHPWHFKHTQHIEMSCNCSCSYSCSCFAPDSTPAPAPTPISIPYPQHTRHLRTSCSADHLGAIVDILGVPNSAPQLWDSPRRSGRAGTANNLAHQELKF